MEKILSIIIPTYNMEKLLRHTLDTLVVSKERLEKLEVLVINDGSKDSSLSIAREYESLYPNAFKAIDKPNGNYGSCINRGMQEASGKYVKVLDADDCFNTNTLESFIDYLSENDADLVLTDFVVVDENDKIDDELTYDLPVGRVFKLSDISPIMSNWIFHQVITYKTEIVRSMGYKQTEGVSYTDDEWALEPMMKVNTVLYYPHVLYRYLRGREGQTCDEKVIRRTLQQRVVVAKSMLEFYKSHVAGFSPVANYYVTEKLTIRIGMVYNHFLTRSYSKDGMPAIIDFDRYLKENNPDIYARLDEYTNSYGMRYIQQWRKKNYSAYCSSLLIMRGKRFLYGILKKNINSLNMPHYLKRK